MTSRPDDKIHPVVAAVTRRITDRSRPHRAAYLARIDEATDRGPARTRLACANLAHGFAAAQPEEKQALRRRVKPNVAIVTAYNDMLSAHQPYADYPPQLKRAVLRAGGIAQVAGGVPAMCDGITQGRDGMQLSLFSRDLIAMSAAVALSHDMFDGALMLGVCDKIVPGLMIGALSFGHLPTVFVPAGPMTSGLPNGEKAAVRQLYAEGKVGREELLDAEAKSYHSAGTCTFYGTANSNQLLMEVMGLHLPGASFANPGTPVREALTRAVAARLTALTPQGGEPTPIGRLVDERTVVNACVALLASGGSTNHTLHLVAIARAAGILLTWADLADLSEVVPSLARVYPNGAADVNHFHAAGGIAFLVHTLLSAGLLHDDVQTIMGRGLWRYTTEPRLAPDGLGSAPGEPGVTWEEGPKASLDEDVLRGVERPFAPDGGVRVLDGPLGTAVIKTSAVKPEHRVVTAPAVVFDDQTELLEAFAAGRLDGRDLVAVVRYQGPAANGMPELHKLTPALGVLQDRGHQVAVVTDGRMSGASGKVPAAIHLTPEAALGGLLSRVRDGDVLTVDAERGIVDIAVPEQDLRARASTGRAPTGEEWVGTGRELFAGFRATVGAADTGASVFPALQPYDFVDEEAPVVEHIWLSEPVTTDALLDLVPVIPVVVVHELETAVPIARALVDGGLPVIELTLRTPVALDAVRLVAEQVPQVRVGAGTVVSPSQAEEARDAGASFLVSPGATPRLLDAMHGTGLPFLPGTATVSEVLAALEAGCGDLKFFPAEQSGGAGYLKALSGVVPAARFCPTGGVTPGNAPAYLSLPNVGCVGGSWLTPADAVAGRDWERIAKLAVAARSLA